MLRQNRFSPSLKFIAREKEHAVEFDARWPALLAPHPIKRPHGDPKKIGNFFRSQIGACVVGQSPLSCAEAVHLAELYYVSSRNATFGISPYFLMLA